MWPLSNVTFTGGKITKKLNVVLGVHFSWGGKGEFKSGLRVDTINMYIYSTSDPPTIPATAWKRSVVGKTSSTEQIDHSKD